jgi:ketosteroid isomerase-like protein
MKPFVLVVSIIVATSAVAVAQNSNSSTTERPRTTTTNLNRSKAPAPPVPAPPKAPAATTPQKPEATADPKPAAKKPASTQQPVASGSDAVLAAFNSLLDGIRKADVNAVTEVYWNSPRLNLFNYNGTVTKGWQQVRTNRESSYAKVSDVKLDVKDVSVTLLGRDGAIVTCQWTQSQTYDGTPETAAGRMTLVFKRVGTAWKAIHLHSSPDTPNPASIPPSEKATPQP